MGLVAMLFAWHVGPRTARADDCLAQPNSSASAGTRWYYHTDRATQRKCWYLRAPDQPAQEPAAQTTSKTTVTSPIPLEKPATVSGAAPMSVTPDAGTPPQPHIKMLSVVSSGATDKLNQQSAKRQNTTSITAASAPEENTSQTGVQATEPARGAAIVWPDPPTPPIATVQDPITTLTSAPTESAPTESVQPASRVRASAHDAEDTTQAGAPTNSAAEARTSLLSEPVEMSLFAAFGLVVAGFLFRIAMTARRRRIFIVRPESDWLDYRNEHELRTNNSPPDRSTSGKSSSMSSSIGLSQVAWTIETSTSCVIVSNRLASLAMEEAHPGLTGIHLYQPRAITALIVLSRMIMDRSKIHNVETATPTSQTRSASLRICLNN
jgi:hypothetical protein